MQAAKISIDYKIPMADSIVLATAKLYEAIVWTQDSDFKGLEGVQYFKGNGHLKIHITNYPYHQQ